jgi:PKD repeat protein
MRRVLALLLALAVAAPAPAQLLPPLPGGSLIVTLTSPSQGATVSGTVAVGASVSIVGTLTVARVDFYVDNALIGSDSTAPYAVSWDTKKVGNGSHTLKAVAQDALGVRWNSSAVTVTVFNDVTAPSVSITAPANGATVSGNVTVSASASDNVGVTGVQFRLDGANLGPQDASAPYAVSWNTTLTGNGSHTLTAVARDAAGNTRTSAAITVSVANGPPPDTTAPSVSISSPANGATVSGTINVTANASDNVGVASVQFRLDGVDAGPPDTSAPYSIAWNTTGASDGTHTISAVARDAAGNQTTSSPVSVTVSNAPPADTTPPTASITSPTNGASVSGTINVTADASDNVGVTSVQFRLDGVDAGAPDTSAPYSIAWNTTGSSDGSHSISAVARDAAGNTRTSAAVTVTVSNAPPADTTPPSVSITAPANGTTVSGTVNVTASASDNVGVAGVQFQLDGVNAGPVLTAAPYSIPWDTATASDGSHTISAVARDAAGNQTTAAPVTITVSNAPPADTTPPAVSISSPANGATVSGTITVSASASDNVGVAGVQFQLDGVNAGPVLTAAPYSIPWDTASASDGSHTLTAIAADAAGNQTTSAPVTVTVANGASPATTRFEEDHAAVSAAPAGAWARIGPEVAAFSGGTAGAANASGATATFTFSGTAVSWLGLKCNACGIATVSLDGAAPVTVDTAGPGAPDGSLVSEAVFSASGLDPAASHTLVITVTGSSNSGGAYIVVDAFDVAGASGGAATRIEETGPGVSAAGAWALRGAETAAFSGGSAGSADTAGSSLTLDFTGTAVSWIGLKCSACGIATVAIDGGEAHAVDTAGPAAPGSPGLASEPVFSASGLAAGSHRLLITVTGTTSTGGAHVIVDAFDVTP